MQHPGSGDQPVDHTDSVEAEGFDGGLVAGYRLVAVRGEGPTGVVYRCVATGAAAAMLGSRPLVMKVLHRELCHPASMVALRSDLDRLALAAESHVAQLLDSGFTEDGRFFLVTEELVGLDLGAALEGAGAVPRERALDVMRQVCRAVRSAHAAGVVHGGLKPRNVFLLAEGEIRVTDFAASRRADAAGGVLFGDPRYMSPEQVGGFSDTRSDVYALGVLLHQLLTGALPSAGASGAEVALLHLHGSARTPAPPSPVPHTAHGAHIAHIDRRLRDICERALDPRLSARYANAGQVLQALEAWSRNDELGKAAALLAGVRGPGRHQATLDVGALEDHTSRRSRMPLVDANRVVSSAAAPPTSDHHGANGHTDSIESSLEDFISQAAKSFGEPADGWSLNTDEVELVDPEETRPPVAPRGAAPPPAPPAAPVPPTPPAAPVGARGAMAPSAAPAVLPSPVAAASAPGVMAVAVAPMAPAVAALAQPTVLASTAVVTPVAAAAPGFSMDPSVPVTEGATGSTAVTAIPVFEEAGAAVPSAEAVLAAPAVVAPVAAAPVVAAPVVAVAAPMTAVAAAPVALATSPVAPARAPRSASPIPVAVGAGVGGAVLVLVIMRIMGPPVAAPIAAPIPAAPVVEPAVTVTPTPRLTPIVTPTVTPIVTPTVTPTVTAINAAPTATPAAAAPANTLIVTPLPAVAAPAAAVGVPVVTPIPAAAAVPREAPSVAPAPVAAPAARSRHRAAAPKAARPVARPAAAKPTPRPVAAPKPAPAAKPAAPASTPKKGDKKGDGWVDPFAG